MKISKNTLKRIIVEEINAYQNENNVLNEANLRHFLKNADPALVGEWNKFMDSRGFNDTEQLANYYKPQSEWAGPNDPGTVLASMPAWVENARLLLYVTWYYQLPFSPDRAPLINPKEEKWGRQQIGFALEDVGAFSGMSLEEFANAALTERAAQKFKQFLPALNNAINAGAKNPDNLRNGARNTEKALTNIASIVMAAQHAPG
jgi:hypothetical protein